MSFICTFGTVATAVGADNYLQIAAVFNSTDNGELQQHAFSTANAGVEDYRSAGKAIAVTGDARPGSWVNTSTNVVSESIDRISVADTTKKELQQILSDNLKNATPIWMHWSYRDMLYNVLRMIIAHAETSNQANLINDTSWNLIKEQAELDWDTRVLYSNTGQWNAIGEEANRVNFYRFVRTNQAPQMVPRPSPTAMTAAPTSSEFIGVDPLAYMIAA